MSEESWWDCLKKDWEANAGNPKARFLLTHFRIASGFQNGGNFWKVLGWPFLVYYKFFIEWILTFELPSSTKVGSGLIIHHGSALVVNPKVRIGRNCVLLHQVTLGTIGDGLEAGVPTIEDGVNIGVGAKVLGALTVGKGARIGAASLILKDVKPGSVVVGNPMRVLRMASENHKGG